jgi:tetratricopeptide (TPR) repeat protein
MLVSAAEESFQKGLRALEDGRRKEAMALFEAAIELERRLGQMARPQARYLSYYGLSICLVKDELREALGFCREALTLEGFNPDLRCNLGRVLMRAGRRKEAYDAFAKGLRFEPGHPEIIRSLRQMGLRRRPALPFLPRTNPLNVIIGRLRTR